MNNKELIQFAINLAPSKNHFAPKRERMQNWICKLHNNPSVMGICLALPKVKIIHGRGFEWEGYETIFKTTRNIISISKNIAERDNKTEIRKILLHEIEHSKMSLENI